MILDTTLIGETAITFPKRFWITRIVTGIVATALQIGGLYAGIVTFGVWMTLGLYSVGVLTAVLQLVVLTRSTSCSRGD